MAWLPFQKEKKEEKNRLDLRAYGNRLNQVPRDTNKKLGPSLELGDEYFYTGPKYSTFISYSLMNKIKS